MLLSKSVRISPSLVGATAAKFNGQSALANVEQYRNLNFTNVLCINGMAGNGSIRGNTINFASITPVALTTVRYYADESKQRKSQSSNVTPSAPSLPNREQVERFLFRLLALIWDIGAWAYFHTNKAIQTHVIANDSVQYYWKRMHERMARAKKEW